MIRFFFFCVGIFLPVGISFAAPSPPEQPTSPQHPGSSYYPDDYREESLGLGDRTITVFLPISTGETLTNVPVVAFGHGHTVPLLSYRRTFQHLAQKGIGVIYVDYDTGWSDGDFERMARDYQNQVVFALKTYSSNFNPSQVVYSGHSNGATVALMAAGLPAEEQKIRPSSLPLFATSSYRKEYLDRLDPATPVSLVIGDHDEGTRPGLMSEIYDSLQVRKKQSILLKSYLMTDPQIIADHGLVRTVGWTGPYETPLHYFGTWKYLVSAAWDALRGGQGSDTYLYGEEAASTGLPDFFHSVTRNW